MTELNHQDHLDEIKRHIHNQRDKSIDRYLMEWKMRTFSNKPPIEIEDLATKKKIYIYSDEYRNNRNAFWKHYFDRAIELIDFSWSFSESYIQQHRLNDTTFIEVLKLYMEEEIEKINEKAKILDLEIATYILTNKRLRYSEIEHTEIDTKVKSEIKHAWYGNILITKITQHNNAKNKFLLSSMNSYPQTGEHDTNDEITITSENFIDIMTQYIFRTEPGLNPTRQNIYNLLIERQGVKYFKAQLHQNFFNSIKGKKFPEIFYIRTILKDSNENNLKLIQINKATAFIVIEDTSANPRNARVGALKLINMPGQGTQYVLIHAISMSRFEEQAVKESVSGVET